MNNGEYLIHLASDPTPENLEKLEEAVEDAQDFYRRAFNYDKFRKSLEPVGPLPVKELRRRIEEASPSPVKEPTLESCYQDQLEYVCRIYEDYAQKDAETMSANEREQYRARMDLMRWGRVALESDRQVEQKLVELKLRSERPHSFE